jgi:TonB-dependent receptor
MTYRTKRRSRTQILLRTATILAGGMFAAAGVAAAAQPAQPEQPEPGTEPTTLAQNEEAIVVTGIRASLANAATAKRESVGFTESVFAEDIGEFPDTNLAESFNRVPGITITREITGEGLNIAIRGLGTNFTRILLNGAPVAIASSGRTDSQNTNREVDLDLFPSELFTQLTVNKSALASMVEGGAAGTVNMRTARPFDRPGMRISYSGQLTNNNNTGRWGGRGSLIASGTWGDFGALVGVAAVRNEVRVTGFETIGWTNPNLTTPQSLAISRRGAGAVPNAQDIADAQCRAGTGCNNTGGGNWSIPGVVPANAGNGLVPGTVINEDFLLANNPGLSLQQLDNGIIPRLGRPAEEFGRKDRISAILALEWRPSDDLHFYLDSMYGRRENDLERIDMNWVGRNGAMVPINLQVDREDCEGGCVVTSGTFANSQWFLEYRPFLEDVEFWGVNPGMEWQIGDRTRIDVQANWTESNFHRESPTVLVNTPASSGVTVEYTNDGTTPVIDTNVDLNDPASFVWAGGRVNIQDERRKTSTRGIRGNLFWGEDEFNIRIGGAYDDVRRRIRAFDNSQAWQNAVCGNQPNVFVPGPNSQPPCQGLNQPGAAPPGYPTYPALGTGFSAGLSGPVSYGGSLIPQSALASYLVPGPSGFVTVDWDRFRADSNYDAFHDAAPEVVGANTGASAGSVREQTLGLYGEFNGDTMFLDRRFRWNIGLRWVQTDQTIGGFTSIPDPRNADFPSNDPATDGARYPNILSFVFSENRYENWLPSANFAYNVLENGILRLALSRTMTRPNPNAMLPGVNFTNPSADVGTRGNPALDPFISDNIDLGFEYYLGAESYFALAAFQKKVEGFTVNGSVTLPFSDLAPFGITFDTLTPTQQVAINSRGGPDVATVVLTQQVNADGELKVRGLEATWVQSLDFVTRGMGIEGFGFSANGTYIDQDGEGAAPAVAVGVARYSYNASFYYENHGISARISTTWNEGSQSTNPNQNGITDAALFTNDYQQWDFSSSLDLAEILDTPNLPELTFDVVNIFEAEQRSYFQFDNAAFTVYQPGRTVLIGLRGSF